VAFSKKINQSESWETGFLLVMKEWSQSDLIVGGYLIQGLRPGNSQPFNQSPTLLLLSIVAFTHRSRSLLEEQHLL
jgi:hypothetical protein